MSIQVPGLAQLTPHHLAPLDYGVIAGYFALTLGIGAWQIRRGARTTGEFFVGGRRLAWWAISLSLFVTGTSSISFMALPARSYQTDWLAFGSVPAQSCAGLVVGILFVPLLHRLDLTTVYGYLERRYDRRVRLLGAALGILLKVGGRMSIVMLLPALALSTVTGLNVYVSIFLLGGITTLYAMEGGFHAVVWTHVLQAAVTLSSLGIALFFILRGVPGGFQGVLQVAEAHSKFHALDLSPSLNEPTLWVFVGMFISSVFTQLCDQPHMQRWFAIGEPRETRRILFLSTVISFGAACCFFLVGTGLFAFYETHGDRLGTGLHNDAIFPFFIANEVPSGLTGFIIAGLFAAAMGALASILNGIAAVIVSDFQGAWRPASSEASRVRLARWATCVFGVLATLMAALLAYKNVHSLWDEFLRLVALIGGGFPGVFALGLLTWRTNSAGAITGALGSVCVTWLVQSFTRTNVFLHGFVAIASCLVIGYLASWVIGRSKNPGELRGLVLWDLFKKRK